MLSSVERDGISNVHLCGVENANKCSNVIVISHDIEFMWPAEGI